jgi:hypothetical protein
MRRILINRARDKGRIPDDWKTFNTQSMLGEALMQQKNYSDCRAAAAQGFSGHGRAREQYSV